jgi:hypothetical protein
MLVNDCEFLRWFLKIRFEQTMVSIAGRNIKKNKIRDLLFRFFGLRGGESLDLRVARYSGFSRHEILSKTDDFRRLQIQREVPGIQDVYLGLRIILLVCFSTGHRKRSIVPPPKNKERRLVVAEPLLPSRVGLDVILVVVKEIQLNLTLPRPVQEIILVYPQIGVVPRWIRRSADVPFAGCLKR